MDGVAVEGGFFFLDDSVMAIDSHRSVIMWKGKKLFLAFHSFVEFDNTIYGNSHTVSVLLVGNVDICLEERNV